jgi:hypothetical protein
MRNTAAKRAQTRRNLVLLILATLPCYCLGVVLLNIGQIASRPLTPTPTATHTQRTPRRTSTPGPSATPLIIPTATQTSTETITWTPSPTYTEFVPPTRTQTGTPTPTETPSPTIVVAPLEPTETPTLPDTTN